MSTTTTDLVHDRMLAHIEETRECLFDEIAMLHAKLDQLLASNKDRDVVAGDGWGRISGWFVSCTAVVASQIALELLYFDLYPDSAVYLKARHEERCGGY